MNEYELQKAFSLVRQGDREAFSDIYRELSKPVYTVALRIVRRRECAEDIAQNVFVKLFLSPPDISVKNLRAWIFRMTHNLAIDTLRTEHVAQTDEMPEDRLTDYDEARHTDWRIDMEQAMAKLSQTEREIVTLHVNGELGFAEIADIEKMSLPATYRAYRRALKRLRESLDG